MAAGDHYGFRYWSRLKQNIDRVISRPCNRDNCVRSSKPCLLDNEAILSSYQTLETKPPTLVSDNREFAKGIGCI